LGSVEEMMLDAVFKAGRRFFTRLFGEPMRTEHRPSRTARRNGILAGPIAKLTAILLILGLNWSGLSAVGTTVAYYSDTETSSENAHVAGSLDFLLDQGDWMPAGGELDLNPGESVSRDITVVDHGTVPFKYIVRPQQTGGDNVFCGELELEAFLEDVSVYSGALFDFVSATTTFGAEADDWTFDVALPGGAPEYDGEICEFDFFFSGWQTTLPDEGKGFHDEERSSNTLQTSADQQCALADFDTDADGAAIAGGQIIDDEYSAWGLTISAKNDDSGGPHLAITFDSGNPTAGDRDLGTPNEDFGGPGIGAGGKSGEPGENSAQQHNVLIIANHDTDANGDGLIDGPLDDEGKIYFVFDKPTYIESILVIDNDTNKNKIILYDDSNNKIGVFTPQNLDDNSAQRIDIATDGVKKIKVKMKESVAVDDLCFNAVARGVVINEFLPNPNGDDDAPMPLGEWVELYNLSDEAVDVDGWYLYDSNDSKPLPISSANSDNDGDTADEGETIVPAGGYLVVYLNGEYSGWLNNSGADSVRLYNGPIGTGALVDSYSYDGRDNSSLSPTPGGENVDDSSGGSGNSIPPNKSYARIPDGTGAFVDPIPTPLAPNTLADADLTQTDAESKLEDADDETEDADGKMEDNPVKPEDEPIMPEEPEDNEDGKLEDGDGGGSGDGGGDMGAAVGGSDPPTVITGTDEQETASAEEIAIAPEQEELPFENEPATDNQQPTTNDINESTEADDEAVEAVGGSDPTVSAVTDADDADDEAVEAVGGSDPPTVITGTDEQETASAEEIAIAPEQEELPFENEPATDNQQPTTNDINKPAVDDDEMPQEAVESENELESDKAEEEPVQLTIIEEPDPVKLPVISKEE
jgi:hypothetical protein